MTRAQPDLTSCQHPQPTNHLPILLLGIIWIIGRLNQIPANTARQFLASAEDSTHLAYVLVPHLRSCSTVFFSLKLHKTNTQRQGVKNRPEPMLYHLHHGAATCYLQCYQSPIQRLALLTHVVFIQQLL